VCDPSGARRMREGFKQEGAECVNVCLTLFFLV